MKDFLIKFPIAIPFIIFGIGLLILYIKYLIQCYIDDRRFWKILKEQADRHQKHKIELMERFVKMVLQELQKKGMIKASNLE